VPDDQPVQFKIGATPQAGQTVVGGNDAFVWSQWKWQDTGITRVKVVQKNTDLLD
jgi:hypothetical protein